MPSTQPIVIVGAGVLGLTTAAVLQDRYAGTRITIVAAEVPLVPPFANAPRPTPDYASMWAGAHSRPTLGNTEQDMDEQKLSLRTSDVIKALARRNPESGIQTIAGREIMEYFPQDKAHLRTGDVYASSQDDGFRILQSYELPPGGKWGCEYETWVANVHVYCRWLLTEFVRKGGNILQKRLERLTDAFDILPPNTPPALVINCSGLNFGTDPKTKVMRGQTVLVKNTHHRTATWHSNDGTWSFLIPRPLGGGTIVGGTKQLRDMTAEVRPEETESILAAAVKYWPDFVRDVKDFEIVAVNVGRRPWRNGGLRVEKETLDNGRTVVHGYGAGTRGYELSWGVADRISRLVGESLNHPARL